MLLTVPLGISKIRQVVILNCKNAQTKGINNVLVTGGSYSIGMCIRNTAQRNRWKHPGKLVMGHHIESRFAPNCTKTGNKLKECNPASCHSECEYVGLSVPVKHQWAYPPLTCCCIVSLLLENSWKSRTTFLLVNSTNVECYLIFGMHSGHFSVLNESTSRIVPFLHSFD